VGIISISGKNRLIPFFLFLYHGLLAQDVPSPEKVEPAPVAVLSETNLTSGAFEAAIQHLGTRTDLEPELQTSLSTTYKEGLSRVKEMEGLTLQKKTHESAIASAPEQLEALKKEINKGGKELTKVNSQLNTDELKPLLTQAEADEGTAQKALEKLREETKRRKSRTGEIPKLIAQAKEKLAEIQTALEAKPSPEEPVDITKANRLLLLARKSYREVELATLQAELKNYQETAELQSLQTDFQTSKATVLSKQVAQLREAIATASKREAEIAAAKAAEEEKRLQEAFWQSFPDLSYIAETNTQLAEELKKLNKRIAGINTELTEHERNLTKLSADFQAVRDRVEAFEMAHVQIDQNIGNLLRKHRSQLNENLIVREARIRLGEITDNSIRELEHNEKRQALADLPSIIESLIQKFKEADLLPDSYTTQKVEKRIQELLKTQREHHNSLTLEYKNLGDLLTRLNGIDIQIQQQSQQFSQYIEERVLWVRSSGILSPDFMISNEVEPLADFLSFRSLSGILDLQRKDLTSNPLSLLGFLIGFIPLIAFRPRLKRARKVWADKGNERENTSLLPTLICIACNAILCAPVPYVLLFEAQYLKGYFLASFLPYGTPWYHFTEGLVTALTYVAAIWFIGRFLKLLTRPDGVGITHLAWAEKGCTLFLNQLRWFLPLTLVLVFMIGYIQNSSPQYQQARLSFMVLMVATMVWNFKLLHPQNGLWPTANRKGASFWSHTLFLVSLIVPAALVICSFLGYHFTAWELAWRFFESIGLFIAILLVRAIGLRWFYLERKRVALEKLKLRQANAQSSMDSGTPTSIDPTLTGINITEIKEQTQSLTHTMVLVCSILGLWGIWSEITPALKILDRDALWYVEVPAEQKEESLIPPAMSLESPESEEDPVSIPPAMVLQPITLADLLYAAGVLVVTFILFRNLPSFLELMILKHMKLETGGAYATTTLVQYVVIGIGSVISLSSIGLSWEKVQWLAAAVTLGIGFGLQEIFANFVAGIILLFERPVRVGDWITVDGTTGNVLRIRIRATTIINRERQELIIPNKDLITGRLTNWTLSDTTNRIVVTVGVAYGTNIQKTQEILLDILNLHPTILTDPEPRVTFDLFGDSSLNFTLRAYLSDMDDRLEAIHTLHEQINNRFQEAGIEISFPQRDLHIRSGLEAFSNDLSEK